MKIKTKLTLNFLLLVAGILLFFSGSVYIFYLQHRYEDFTIRLRNKAINSATLLFTIQGIDSRLLKIIDDNTVTNMNDVAVIIADKKENIIYSNRDSLDVIEQMPQFLKLNWDKNDRILVDKKLYLCLQRHYNNTNYYILASAIDLYGQQELKKLLIILISVFVVSILLIVFAGYFNAHQSLKPIKDIIDQVSGIKANNLSKRLEVRNKDEIAELSATFNKMLERIEHAFETERTFVSNVSHELRTPVTSIIGQTEVALLNRRKEEDYQSLLVSILDDVKNMKNIINGFLDLADAGSDSAYHKFTLLRLDELLFSVKDEVIKRKPNYLVLVGFENIPEDEKEITIFGNERLLRILLINLIDNACKFSDQHKVIIKIGYNITSVTLQFIDQGIGIPAEDISHIFEPLYKARNTSGKEGHGIGLSIVKRIADVHDATIDIVSELNLGTSISIVFPKRIQN